MPTFDEPSGLAAAAPLKPSFEIPRGSPRRHAIEIFYWNYLKFTVGVNIEAATQYHAELKPRLTKSTFLTASNAWKSTLPGGGMADGLDDPVYRHTVDGVCHHAARFSR